MAARLRAEGEAQYTTITSQADRTRDTLLAQADAEAERIRGQAQAESTRILNEAHARDPKFYELLRTLESYGVDSRFQGDGRALVVQPLAEAAEPAVPARSRRARPPEGRRPPARPSS